MRLDRHPLGLRLTRAPANRSRPFRAPGSVGAMSKKTNKRKIKARKSKANHGTKPNAGRG